MRDVSGRLHPTGKSGVSSAQLLVLDLASQVVAGQQGLRRRGLRRRVEACALVAHEDLPAQLASGKPRPRERLLLLGRVRPFDARGDPDRGALEDRQVLGAASDLRHVLDGARAGPDRGDAGTVDGCVVLPTRGVERASAERLAAGDGGREGDVEHAEGAHEHVGGERLTGGAGQRPPLVVVAPARFGDLSPRAHPRTDSEVVGDLLQVGEDLRLVGVGLAPPGVRGERVAVQVRRHVTGRTGVGVVEPGAADVVRLLVDREVVAGLLEPHPHRDATCTGAEHRDLGTSAHPCCA